MADNPDDQQPVAANRRWWRWGVAAVVVIGLAAAAPVVLSLGDVTRVPVDAGDARDRLANRTAVPTPSGGPEVIVISPDPTLSGSPSASPSDSPSASPSPDAVSVLGPDDDAYRSFLVIGSDARAGLAGSRADVIIMGLMPADGSDPVMLSLPRDLWLDDPCRGGHQRINAAYNGCGASANGFELLSIVVEDFTGVAVDHVVAIDFEGFKQVIDAVGGVQICVEHPVRDGGKLDLAAGCTTADGDQALGWVRSRKTQEFVDGRWRTMPGVNDLTRNRRQQDLMLQLLGRVGSFDTVGNLYSFAEGVSDSVTLGSNLTMLDGVRVAWSMRGKSGDIQRFSIPVRDMTTSGGAQVLVPTESFATTFEQAIGHPLTSDG